jgi:biopolymer transport protein ExbB/TolQ
MNSSRIWKVTLGLIGLFILGSLFGAGVQTRWVGRAAAWRTGWMERWADRQFERRVDDLSLRPEQVAALAESRREMLADLRALQQETARRAWDIVARQNQRIWRELDETQRQEFLRLQRERRGRNGSTSPAP